MTAGAERPSEQRPRASVYIDGFNLYRRLLSKRPQDKWLDVEALSEALLPEYDIVRVRYFTAFIKVLPGADPKSQQRQQAYVRALQTLPRTSIHLGQFRIDKRLMPTHPVERDEEGQPRMVNVRKTEEKGSDVSLAAHLMLDAVRGDSDVYTVCSNDSDLVTPLTLVRDELGRATGLLSPMEPKRASNQLKQTRPVLHRQVTPHTLASSQLPDVLHDETGPIHRPPEWRQDSEGPAAAGPSNQRPKPTGDV